MSAALSCPWCSGEAVAQQYRARNWGVGCVSNHCPVSPEAHSTSKAKAITAWNTRTQAPEAIRAAALEEAAKVAEQMPDKEWTDYVRPAVETVDEYGDPDFIPEQRGRIGKFTSPKDVAAAIRALIQPSSERIGE